MLNHDRASLFQRTGAQSIAGCAMNIHFCPETRLAVRTAQDAGLSARDTMAQLVDGAPFRTGATCAPETTGRIPSLRTIQRWRRKHRAQEQVLSLQKPIRATRIISLQQVKNENRLAQLRSRQTKKTKHLKTHVKGAEGWQIVRGCCHRTTGYALRASPAEQALRATLTLRVLKSTRQRLHREYVVKTAADTFAYNRLFRTKNRADPNRFIWHDLKAKEINMFFTISTAVATALNLPGRPSEISLIVSRKGAREQHKHVDSESEQAFSFLFALSRRYVHVDDKHSGIQRLLRLDAGDLLILRGGTCHAASPHPLQRISTLVFVAYNFDTNNATTFCSK